MPIEYTIGADPELFLVDSKGKFKSAHDLIPGSKADPAPVMNGFIQPDGVAAEFNIRPAKTAEEFTGYIRDVLTELTQRLETTGLMLRVSPTARFDKRYFKKLPPEAKALGCEPDYNVWTGAMTEPPHTTEPFRTGAGHIHVGWTQDQKIDDDAHKYDCYEMTRQLDAVLYFCSLLWDNDTKRRTLYGLMGSHRVKSYGVEYRPLSNAWVADPDLHIWVFEATLKAAKLLDANGGLFNDKEISKLIHDELAGNKADRFRVLDHYHRLVEDFDIPPLPEAYVRVTH